MLPELETDRLILRELSLEDAPALAFQGDPEHSRLQAVEPADFSDPAERISNYFKYRGEGARRRLFVYTARTKSDGAVLASVSLDRSHPAIASIGLTIATHESGRGYGTELTRRILAFGFGEIGLNRIAADVAVENLACRRVMEKAGLTFEGISRDIIFAQGRWWTEARYAILARDMA